MTDLNEYKFLHFPSPRPIGPLIHGSLLGSIGPNLAGLPVEVDLRPRTTFQPYDQGSIGSCTANAVAAAIRFLDPSFVPSRLYLYYHARALRGNEEVDSGSAITDNVKVANTRGVPSETVYPYVTSQFKVRPPPDADTDAELHRGIDRQSLYNSPESLKAALAAGYPVPIGYNVYQSFMETQSMTTGVAPMPNPATERYLGNHCVALWGYSDIKQHYIILNSWGSGRGDKGYFYMPYAQIHNPSLAWDPWVIRKMSTPVYTTPGLNIPANTTVVSPGQYTYPITIKNNDSVKATILLEAIIPSALSGSVSANNYVLDASITTQSTLNLTVATSTPVGVYEIAIVATNILSKLTTRSTFTVTVQVVQPLVVRKVPLLYFNVLDAVATNGTNIYNITLKNEDSVTSVVALSRSVPYPWASAFSANNHLLVAGETKIITLSVTVPNNVVPGKYPIRIAGRNIDSNLKTEAGFDLVVQEQVVADVVLTNITPDTMGYLVALKKRMPTCKVFVLQVGTITPGQRTALETVATIIDLSSSSVGAVTTRLGAAKAEDYLMYKSLLYLATRKIPYNVVSKVTGMSEVLTLSASDVPIWMESTIDKLL